MKKFINVLEQLKEQTLEEMFAEEIGSFNFVKLSNEIAEITYTIENAANTDEVKQMLYRTTSDKLCVAINEYLK